MGELSAKGIGSRNPIQEDVNNFIYHYRWTHMWLWRPKSGAHMRLQEGHGTAGAFEACHRKPVWRRSRAAARR
jgi:hypothetical protein